MPRIRLNINVVDAGTAAGSSMNSIATAINQKHENFVLVNSSGQVLASIVSAAPFLKPVTLQANTFAATASFLQLWIDVSEGASSTAIISNVLNIVGNVSGIVATGALLAGAAAGSGLVVGATVVAIAATVTNLLVGAGAIDKLHDWSTGIIDTWAPPEGIPITTDHFFMDTGGFWRDYWDIQADPAAGTGGIIIEHNNWEAAGAYFLDTNAAPPPPPRPKDYDPWDNPAFIPTPPLETI